MSKLKSAFLYVTWKLAKNEITIAVFKILEMNWNLETDYLGNVILELICTKNEGKSEHIL